eukprot:TRINITY_DN422_c0_g1_i2.p1 TRINITY_DN422_c0_g1~~TRINITY_DN422_c0_g1_i2.p1  ORF type:complete len:113 (-),score=11.52 TRINITY_DN422_c0_g1_i2:87-425(-)
MQWKELMLIKNAPSLEMFQFVEELLRDYVCPQRCKELQSLEGITCISLKKYKRFEKRHKNVPVHCAPCFAPKEGDIIICGQCRPLSKTVRYNVVKVIPNQIVGTVKKVFMLF